jgi:acetoin utilization protein AcuC
MPCKTAVIVHDDYLKYDFGPWHPFKPYRWRLVLEILEKKKVFETGYVERISARYATLEELMLVHTPEYIEYVKRMSERGEGFLDYGDTPARKGVFEGAVVRVGGSLVGIDLLMNNVYKHAFNPCGGLHHAREDAAAGFCVFNDIAIAARYAQKRYNIRKIAIIDVDGHHGDGTQNIFYEDPDVLTISLHRYGIYPGTGWYTEVGSGAGEGFSINIPLPEGVDDISYLYMFNNIVVPVVREYKPELIILQYGADSHYEDPLVGLGLTTRGYQEIMDTVHKLSHELSSGRILVTGGGGYNVNNTARIWSIGVIRLAGLDIDIEDLHDKVVYVRESPSQYIIDLAEKIRSYLKKYYKDL